MKALLSGIIFVQYGDYRQAYLNMRAGGEQQYYAQRHSVNYVGTLVQEFTDVTVVCLSADYPYEILPNGVGVIGINVRRYGDKTVLDYVSSLALSHIVLRTPSRIILKYAVRKNIAILPIIADSFKRKGVGSIFSHYILSRALNNTKIKYIGNHSLNASLSLANIGVLAEKIIPWDWPHTVVPELFDVKTEISSIPTLFYAGQISKEKGIYDLIDAIELISNVTSVALEVAGNDKDNQLQSYIKYKNLESYITLLGMLPQPDVINRMALADMVIVPSRHEYPEGLPMTIYEGLASRTPLVVSNHAMFVNKVVDRVSGIIFEAGQAESLAQKCLSLIADADLYNKISINSAEAWYALKIKVEWTELVSHFIRDDLEKNDIEKISLVSYEGSNV
tara:strand:+ start:6860 stop:8035 length:1176 start_codon:yes stop_codon:yes gene_type:complete